MMNEAVRSLMTTNLITVTPTTNLHTVRQIFMKNAIHHLPVTNDDNRLVGILTTYDLWKNEIAPHDYSRVLVEEIMSTKIAKINPWDKIGTAAEIFLDNRFHALPVVDNHNRLIGIVTSHDVLRYEYMKEYPKPLLFKELLAGLQSKSLRRISA